MLDRRQLFRALPALGLAASWLVIGCAGRMPPPDISAGAFQGPPIELDRSGDTYVALVHAPTPGWVPTLDRVMDGYKHQAIFVTLRRPNPAFLYPQVVVDQRIATGVSTTQPARVYARALSFDANPDRSDAAYSLATSSPPP